MKTTFQLFLLFCCSFFFTTAKSQSTYQIVSKEEALAIVQKNFQGTDADYYIADSTESNLNLTA